MVSESRHLSGCSRPGVGNLDPPAAGTTSPIRHYKTPTVPGMSPRGMMGFVPSVQLKCHSCLPILLTRSGQLWDPRCGESTFPMRHYISENHRQILLKLPTQILTFTPSHFIRPSKLFYRKQGVTETEGMLIVACFRRNKFLIYLKSGKDDHLWDLSWMVQIIKCSSDD